jgi:hypothetical protein
MIHIEEAEYESIEDTPLAISCGHDNIFQIYKYFMMHLAHAVFFQDRSETQMEFPNMTIVTDTTTKVMLKQGFL